MRPNPSRFAVALFLVSVPLTAQDSPRPVPPGIDPDAPLPELTLPSQEEELELAVRAAPAAVSSEATIWVSGRDGYVVAREGSTGWGCLIQYSMSGTARFPRCDDPDRVRTLFPTFFLLEEMRREGATASQYLARLEEGYASGEFSPPPRGAISYMYAPGPIPPHIMIAQPACDESTVGLTSPSAMAEAGLGLTILDMGEPTCDLILFVSVDSAGSR